MYKFRVEKYIFAFFCVKTIHGQTGTIVNNTKNTYTLVKILLDIAVR